MPVAAPGCVVGLWIATPRRRGVIFSLKNLTTMRHWLWWFPGAVNGFNTLLRMWPAQHMDGYRWDRIFTRFPRGILGLFWIMGGAVGPITSPGIGVLGPG